MVAFNLANSLSLIPGAVLLAITLGKNIIRRRDGMAVNMLALRKALAGLAVMSCLTDGVDGIE
jgi:hypothetical protein